MCEANAELLFEPTVLPKISINPSEISFDREVMAESRDVSIDSNSSTTNIGNWVKKVIKIQKVMKMLERNLYPKQETSAICEPLITLLKEHLHEKYSDLLPVKKVRRIATLQDSKAYHNVSFPSPIDESVEFEIDLFDEPAFKPVRKNKVTLEMESPQFCYQRPDMAHSTRSQLYGTD